MEENLIVLTDSELVKMGQEGSETAIEILIKKYEPIITYISNSYITSFKDNLIDMDVIYQEGRLGILDAINSFDSNKNASFKTYASRCINNRVINGLKKKANINSNIKSLDEFMEDDSSLQIASNINIEEDVLLNEIFNSLTSKDSKVFSKFEKTVLIELLRGLNYKEIAESLEKTPKQIDNTIQRIKKKVSSYLIK